MSLPAESLPPDLPLLTAEEYGGPQLASLAMLMVASGVTSKIGIPDKLHVSAFAHHDCRAESDIKTVLGAASSFLQTGFEVCYIGDPTVGGPEDPNGQLALWFARRQPDGRSGRAEYYNREPTTGDIDRLITGGWSMKCDLAGSAIQLGNSGVQPTFLVHNRGDKLIVNNPGGPEAIPAESQLVDLYEAFDDTVVGLGILAVRRPNNPVMGTRIRPAAAA